MYSLFFPIHCTTPFELGLNHIQNGWNQLRNGHAQEGILRIALGALECTPFINYPVAYLERKYRLADASQKIQERQLELSNEVVSESVSLQQFYFETYNSHLKISSEIEGISVAKVFDFSYPDRESAILIHNLESFPLRNAKIDDIIGQLKQMAPIAHLITCLLVEQTERGRQEILEALKNIIIQQIENLKIGEMMILPLGYTERDIHDLNPTEIRSPGHITLMELTRTDKDRCQIRIFNSGEGSDTHIKGSDSESVYPWMIQSTFEVLSNPSYWEELLKALTDGNHQMSAAYAKFDMISIEGVPHEPSSVKSYRIQFINHCPKKSLQVWLHDQLKDDPILYQQFRIFNLQKLLSQLDQMLEKYGSVIVVNHSVALWGGSEKINRLLHNVYYQVRGFLSGPHVKCSVSRADLIIMKQYGKTLLTLREARLKCLTSGVTEGLNHIINSNHDSLTKGRILQEYTRFLKKNAFDLSEIKDVKILSEQEVDQLCSEEEITKLMDEKDKNLATELKRAFVLQELTEKLLLCNETEKALETTQKISFLTLKTNNMIKVLTAYLEKNDSRAKKLQEDIIKLIESMPELINRLTYLSQLIIATFPYDKVSSYCNLEKLLRIMHKEYFILRDLAIDLAPFDFDKAVEIARYIPEEQRFATLNKLLELSIKKKKEKFPEIKKEMLTLIEKMDPNLKGLNLAGDFLKIVASYDAEEAKRIANLALEATKDMNNESWKSYVLKNISSFQKNETKVGLRIS